MDAETLTRATAFDGGVHGAGAAPVDALGFFVPFENAFSPGVAIDHPVGIVVGVMCQCFKGHEITGIDNRLGLKALAEIAPVNGLVVGRNLPVCG